MMITITFVCRWDDSFYAGGIFVALSGLCAYAIGALRVESEYDDEDENNNDDEQKQLK